MFQVKVTFTNGHQEAYIVRCAIECIIDILKADYEVKLDDIRQVDILRISSASAIRQGKR